MAFTNNGTVQVLSGTLNIGDGYTQNGGSTTIANGALLAAGGTVNIVAGSFAVFGMVNGNVRNSGTLSGSGTVNGSVLNASQINPGGTVTTGILTIIGDYTQTSAGTLNVRIGGANAGTGYDRLVITGTATIDGTLNVSLINGFLPTSGDTFQILTFNSVNGMFALLNIDLSFKPPVYSNMDVTLQAI